MTSDYFKDLAKRARKQEKKLRDSLDFARGPEKEMVKETLYAVHTLEMALGIEQWKTIAEKAEREEDWV